jgi:hypothetical protein
MAEEVGRNTKPGSQAIVRKPGAQVVFDNVVFYDGYAAKVDTAPVSPGVLRLANHLNARKLDHAALTAIGGDLTFKLDVKAACDNYDRIGHVGLALTPKGALTYDPETTPRIEIGRFITPFMDKNRQPDTVPYTFQADQVAQILNDVALLDRYDFWVETSIFGTSSAARTQVSGCAGRNDVFVASLNMVSTQPARSGGAPLFLQPLSHLKDLNNYAADATDAVGQTVRSFKFTTSSSVANARLVVLTSAHGAGNGGEEYQRRVHQLFFDDIQVATYTPGGESCEPYRRYNTMGNGIYGFSPRSDQSWANSNWCPGASVNSRQIELNTIAPGSHTFKIAVPGARFSGRDGRIVVSVWVLGVAN